MKFLRSDYLHAKTLQYQGNTEPSTQKKTAPFGAVLENLKIYFKKRQQ